MRYPLLAVQDNMVTLQKQQFALWYQHGSVALDHGNDRLAGNVPIPNPLIIPGIWLQRNDLL